jgi:hypothetical protein
MVFLLACKDKHSRSKLLKAIGAPEADFQGGQKKIFASMRRHPIFAGVLSFSYQERQRVMAR